MSRLPKWAISGWQQCSRTRAWRPTRTRPVLLSVCSQRFKQKAKDDLQSNTLKLEYFDVKECVSDKYLGQVLHGGGLDDSALAIVREMAAKIKGDINHN